MSQVDHHDGGTSTISTDCRTLDAPPTLWSHDDGPSVDQLPPCAIDAEQALLGAILVNNEAYHRVAHLLLPGHFHEPVHRRIFAAIQRRIKAGRLADPITIHQLFAEDPDLAGVDGPGYLSRLAYAAESIINAEHYARHVVNLAARRELLRAAEAIAQEARDTTLDDDAATLAARARERLDAATVGAALAAPRITATAFDWINPAEIPPRRWLYGRQLIRGFVSVTAAAGGAAKTTLAVADAVAMATGRPLLQVKPHEGALRVWIWNLEDPREELERRIAAAVLHHGVKPAEIDGRIFLDSGRDQGLCLATADRADTMIAEPVIDALVDELLRREIDVLVIDPFVSSHRVGENDNVAIDAVVKAWGRVAHRANCAVELVHHARKLNGEEVTAESARGAVALIGAARSVRVLQGMTDAEAAKAGLDDTERRALVRVDPTAKANLGPLEAARWVRLVPVELPNGDNVATVEAWTWPDAMNGLGADDLLAVQRALAGQAFRANIQADRWAGHVIGRTLGFSTETRAGKARAKALLKEWTRVGALAVVEARDQDARRAKQVIEVSQWATG